MIRYLVDTNVISSLAPGVIHPACGAWMLAHEGDVALSVVSLAEIESGIAKLRRDGKASKAVLFADWKDALVRTYEDRFLAFDLAAGQVAGSLQDRARAIGRDPGFADIAIAATAVRYRLTLATLNVRHFAPLGIDLIDPSAQLP